MTEPVHRQAHFKIYTKALVVFSVMCKVQTRVWQSSSRNPSTLSVTVFLLTVIQINALAEQVCWQCCIQESIEQLNIKAAVKKKIFCLVEPYVRTTKTLPQIHCLCWALSGAPAPHHPTTENIWRANPNEMYKWWNSVDKADTKMLLTLIFSVITNTNFLNCFQIMEGDINW